MAAAGTTTCSRRLVACVVCAATALLSCTQRPLPRFTNLVIVMVDTLRLDHLGGYGYERDTAPFLRRLGEEGLQLEGYAASSWTKPSIATLLTGLHPQVHQAIERADGLPSELPYLPEILADAGHRTAAFVSNLNVGRKLGFDRGFTDYAQVRGHRKIDAGAVNRRVVGLSEGLAPPYFLYVHYVDPHDPYRPERSWGQEGGESPARVQPRHVTRGGLPLTAQAVAAMIDQYDGEILETDRAIEALLGDLEARGLLEDTLVLVTSDHGEEFGEHGRLTHGRSLYQEVIRVPFIVWDTEGRIGDASTTRFHQIDALPTLLDALGQPIPDGLSGTSRWAQLNGHGPEDRPGPLLPPRSRRRRLTGSAARRPEARARDARAGAAAVRPVGRRR